MNNSFLQNSRIWLCVVAFTLAITPVRGDTVTNVYAGDTWAFEDVLKILAPAADITPEKYPDSDQATVEEKIVRTYQPDGTGGSQDEAFVKVLTEKGKRASRTLTLSYQLPYTTVSVERLEVLKPDGTVVPVDVAANSKDSIDASQMAMNISDPNSRVVQVNIPKLEVGDMVHSITRQTTERAIIPGEFSDVNVFESSGYIRHMSYEIHAPAGRPLQHLALRDEIPGTVNYAAQTNADGLATHRWDVSNVPRMFDEPSMPPYEMVLQRLYVSTLPDWQAVSKWYWDLSKAHLDAITPEMKITNALLTASAKTDLDKIKALFYYVSKNVRYMGLTPEKDRPGFEPHDVCLTFDKNYGVCRDKAALLVAMLREAGLNAYPVLISVGVRRDPVVPDPDFNHAIVSVELEKGKYLLMDPTDENTRDLLPTYDANQSYLVCRPEGEQLLISPVPPPEQHLMRITTTGTLNAAGGLEAKTELSFEGVNDDEYRNAFVKMKPDDVRRFFERNLKASVPGAKLISIQLRPENMLDMVTNVRAELEFSADGMTASGSGKSIVTVPWVGNDIGIINFILRDTGLEKRKYPLQTSTTCGLEETISLKLDGFAGAVSMPNCPTVDDDCLVSQRHFDLQNGTLDCTRELKLKVVEFSPAQYLTLKKTLKELEYDNRKDPVLALAKNAAVPSAKTDNSTAENPVTSDATILESQKTLEVTDAHTAVYRVKYAKRILSYNGKKREAELKLDYNPSCQQARLVSGVVIAKTGERQEISAGEINAMDAAWNASAKRYTGGKILVANLPNVDIGSTIEVEFEIISTNKPFLAGFESFQLPDELEHKSFELTAPEKIQVEKMISGVSGLIQGGQKNAGGRQQFSWTATNVPANPAEAQLPPEWTYDSGVGYFIGDVNEYYAELQRTMLDRAEKSSQAAALARQLAAKSTNQLDTVKAIRDFIAENIRVAGPSFAELPLSELSAADTTLADGYGHLADRAILFYAMLRGAGFQPEIVMASDLPDIKGITDAAKKFPLPQNFQTPLIRVTVAGATYYLNDTDQYSQLGTTAHDGRLGVMLVSRALKTIHATTDCSEQTETLFNLSLANDGKAQIGVTRRYYGSIFNEKKRFFAELPPEERRRYFQETVSEVAQGAQPVGDLITSFDSYPGTEQFTVTIDDYAVVDGSYSYLDLPFTPSLSPASTDRRVLPLFISRQNKNVIRTEIILPANFQDVIIAPKSETLKEAGGVARIKSLQTGGKYIITHELDSVPAIVSPKEYQTLLKVESALSKKSATVLLLAK